MTYQQVYKSQHARVVRESILRASVFGALAGLGVAAVIAIATMFVTFNGLWTAIGSGLGVAAITTVVLYFVKFRPTEKSVAQSIDKQGFAERALTMLEFNQDRSVMAELQRANAIEVITAAAEKNGGKLNTIKASSVSQKLREYGLTKNMLIVLGGVVAIAIVSLVLTALPAQQVKELFLGTNSYGVTLNVGEHGGFATNPKGDGVFAVDREIERKGKYNDTIDEGKYGDRIVVVADDNERDAWMFVGWNDDYYDEFNGAARSDKVNSGINATAQYEQVETPETIIEDDMPQFGMVPPSPNQDEGDSIPNPDGGGDGSSSSDAHKNDEVLDGHTPLDEKYNDWREEAMERLAEGKDLPDSLRDMLASYFESLK